MYPNFTTGRITHSIQITKQLFTPPSSIDYTNSAFFFKKKEKIQAKLPAVLITLMPFYITHRNQTENINN